MLKQASDEKDISDFKDAIQILSKAAPDYTYPRLEKEFRKRGYNVYLIAMVCLFPRLSLNLTYTDLCLRRRTLEKPGPTSIFKEKSARNMQSATSPLTNLNVLHWLQSGLPQLMKTSLVLLMLVFHSIVASTSVPIVESSVTSQEAALTRRFRKNRPPSAATCAERVVIVSVTALKSERLVDVLARSANLRITLRRCIPSCLET